MIKKEIMIPKTVYESTDGRQFERQFEAEKWDCQLYFDANMLNRYCNVMKTGYCLVNSKEEAEILQTLSIGDYIQKGFYAHYLAEVVNFPIMVKFTEQFDKPTKTVTAEDYKEFEDMAKRFKALCEMYESSLIDTEALETVEKAEG